MKNKTNAILVGMGFNILFLGFLFTFILAVRYYDIGNIAFVQWDVHIPSIRIYGNGIILGILVGIPYTLMEVHLRKRGLYHYSLGRIMLNRTLIQFGITSIVLTMIAYLNYHLDVQNKQIDVNNVKFLDYIFSATVQFLFAGAFFGNIVLSVFRTLQLKIGEDIFYKLLLGKYRPAQEEDRAFLFLDLKSSTTIAEKLGHVNYSFFIQDCFNDLHFSVLKYKAMVYQYVGDEAVLTWSSDIALENNNCIHAFFDFNQQLDSRKEYYMDKYGQVPEFKAGLNMGPVMVAEVGVIKREIAYHSDVLNTAARIQGLCNEKQARLLISDTVASKMTPSNNFTLYEKGVVELRGRGEKVRIHEVVESG